MTDQMDRERESRESDITKFEEIRQQEQAERDEAAERVQDTPPEPDQSES